MQQISASNAARHLQSQKKTDFFWERSTGQCEFLVYCGVHPVSAAVMAESPVKDRVAWLHALAVEDMPSSCDIFLTHASDV